MTKASKKHTPAPTKQPTPATPSSPIATAIPATADITDMEEDTPTSIPMCPISFKPDRLWKYAGFSDEEFLSAASTLKAATDQKPGIVKTFLDTNSVEFIAASIK